MSFSYTVITSKDFSPHLTAVTKTVDIYLRPKEQRLVSKIPLNIVILINKMSSSNWTCVSTISLLQQDLKEWFEDPCDSQTRIDFVIRFRHGVPVHVKTCANDQL